MCIFVTWLATFFKRVPPTTSLPEVSHLVVT